MDALARITRSKFIRHNAVFFVGAVGVGALNYLYYPVLGRLLAPPAFGEVQTLVSLFLQLNVFLVVLSMVIVTIVANYTDRAKRNLLVFEFEKLALVASALLFAATVGLGPQLQAWLKFDSPWPFAVLGLAVVAAVPFTLRGAYLRGKQRFGLVAGSNTLVASGKLALSVVLVLAGLGTLGAMSGLLLAQVGACALVMYWAWRAGLRPVAQPAKWLPNLRLLAPELRYAGIVLAASLAITLQYSVDIVLVKHYFDATTAGLYAGIAAVARIMFFLTASIAQVLLSKINLQAPAVHNRRLLHKSFVLLGGISLPMLAVMMLFPGPVIGLLMGEAYLPLAGLLPKLALAVFFVSVINLLAIYHLALKRYAAALIAVVGAELTFLFILLQHGSPAAVVNSLLLGSAVSLGLFGVWKLTERRERV